MQNKTDRALLVEVANDVELMGDKVCELNSRFTTMRNEIARQAALITEQEATIDEQDAHAGKQAVVIDELKATIDYKDMMIASLDTLYDRDQKRATAHEEEASAAKQEIRDLQDKVDKLEEKLEAAQSHPPIVPCMRKRKRATANAYKPRRLNFDDGGKTCLRDLVWDDTAGHMVYA